MDKIKPAPSMLEHVTINARYIPAFYFSFLTPFYDIMMTVGARESAFKFYVF